MTLQGGDELRQRLAAISDLFEPVAYAWTKDAVALMRSRVRSPSGRMRRSINGKATGRAALVFADYRVTFQDKGTKAHDVKPKKAKAVGFGYGTPNAHFARKLHVRGVRKKPFIRRSAREALKNNPLAGELLKAWRMEGRYSRKYVLGNTTAAKRRAAARTVK